MRINTHFQPSRIKTSVEVLLVATVILVVACSEIPILMMVMVLTSIVGMMVYQKFLQQAPAHLVQLIQFDKHDWRWLVYDQRRIKKSLIQEGRLISVHHWFFVLLMRFETIDKNKKTTQSWIIWRDQVDAEHWRRLIVIARFWADDVQQMNG